MVECGVRGVRNALIALGMVDGEPVMPEYQAFIDETQWMRAEVGGILQFHIAPGSLIEKGAPRDRLARPESEERERRLREDHDPEPGGGLNDERA